MAPYLGFFASYLIFVFYILDASEDFTEEQVSGGETYPRWFFAIEKFWNVLLVLYSLYFLQQEFRQLKKQRWGYLNDIWNYADFIPPILIIAVMIVDVFYNDLNHPNMVNFRYAMQAVASFGMWTKIFYFLRIFRSTGFFVNMLLRVVKSSRTFFLLYILILGAFACSFYIMSPTNEGLFYHFNYSYLLGLGEFDMEYTNYRTPGMMHFFFLIATLIVQIVMLNLLIAIISTAYEEVTSTQQ